MYLGDFAEDALLNFKWNTHDGSGASITRSTNGTIIVFKGSSTTTSSVGITDTEDFAGIVGLHHCTIDLSSDAFYATGSDYQIVLSGSVIASQSVNAVIGHFSIENRFDEVDVAKINGNVPAAISLGKSAEQIIRGTITTASFSPSITEFDSSDVVEATSNHFNGRVVIFTSGALASQATDITAYELSGSFGHFTVTALTEAPSHNDTFLIV